MDTEDVPLLEREAQLASLREYAGEARCGDGRMVLVAGEAGVGKSALVEQVQRDLPDANWFWGRATGCSPRGRSGRCSTSRPSSAASCSSCAARMPPGRTAPPSAADELLASGLLTGDGVAVSFRHEIVRMAVAGAIPPLRCGLIHARILDALRDRGCGDDVRLAFHAEGAGDGPAVLRYAPAAARRAAGLGSHREAAAQFERALRFGDGLDQAGRAGLFDGLAAEAGLVDRWQEAADAQQRALALWHQAGDRRREGATMRQLSRTMWRLCRGQESLAAGEAAVSLLEPLGPTPELAWAYANLAGQRIEDSQNEAAIGLARQAQALAESLGVPEVLSDALNTQGCALAGLGGDWTGPLERALQIAESEGLQDQAGRAFGNVHSTYCCQLRFAEAEPYFVDGTAYCDEHDIGTYGLCLRGERTCRLEMLGRRDESAALSLDLLTRSGASPVNRINPLTSLGKILARRGEPGAWERLDEAMRSADGTAEPQHILRVRLARAETCWLEARAADARREAELADDVSAGTDGWERGMIADWLRRTRSARPSRGWPILTSSRPAAAGSRPRGSGPGWAAPTRPPWPCSSPGRSRCERRWASSPASQPQPLATPGRPCASSASGPSRPGRGPRRGRIRAG